MFVDAKSWDAHVYNSTRKPLFSFATPHTYYCSAYDFLLCDFADVKTIPTASDMNTYRLTNQ